MGKYQQKSLQTKKRLANSLKKLMNNKDFHHITVNDIVSNSNLNRNSFYYHFTDIYDLLKWTFENDATEVISKISSSNDMRKAILFVMEYIDDNNKFCKCAFESLGRDALKKFFISDFQEIIIQLINYIISKNNYSISNDFINYITYSHTELIAAHLVSYLKGEFKISKEKIINYILITFHSSLETSLKIVHENKL